VGNFDKNKNDKEFRFWIGALIGALSLALWAGGAHPSIWIPAIVITLTYWGWHATHGGL
jgi:hypothetical protein